VRAEIFIPSATTNALKRGNFRPRVENADPLAVAMPMSSAVHRRRARAMAGRVRDEAVVLGRAKGTARQRRELDPLLRRSRGSPAVRRQLRLLMAARRRAAATAASELVRALPADTFLETAVAAFRGTTDIPLELPLAAAVAMVNAHILESGAVIDLRGQRISPALWTVVLAPSGSGKTFAIQRLLDATGADFNRFAEPASAAAFVDNLERANRGLWIRDEFGHFLRNLEDQKHLAELRDYLLQLYDGVRIERHTRKQSVVVADPALTIFGAHVDATWHDCVPAQGLVDGFAQRFNYIMSRERQDDVRPIYDLSHWYPRLRETWRRLSAVPLAPVYTVGEDALAAFEAAFHDFRASVGREIDASFFRRVMFAGFRYALVYHVVRGRPEPRLDAADIGWAVQMTWRHLCDAARMLDRAGLGDLSHRLERVRRVLTKARARGEVTAPRDVQQSLKVPAEHARALLELALEGDPAATPAERERAAGGGRR
jgi:hypothetical protein